MPWLAEQKSTGETRKETQTGVNYPTLKGWGLITPQGITGFSLLSLSSLSGAIGAFPYGNAFP